MEGLFFAVDPVWWIAPIHLSSLIIALLGGGVVGCILWYRWSRSRVAPVRRERGRYEFHPTSPIDPNYTEKTLIEIRKYLTYQHQPRHSWAHIPDDISEYSENTRLIEIIEQLERSEYSGEKIQASEMESINRELKIILV